MLRRLWLWLLTLAGIKRHVLLPATIKASVTKQ